MSAPPIGLMIENSDGNASRKATSAVGAALRQSTIMAFDSPPVSSNQPYISPEAAGAARRSVWHPARNPLSFASTQATRRRSVPGEKSARRRGVLLVLAATVL